MLLIVIILLILGFVILIKSADLLVEGASSVAKRLNISDLIIGLTVVSFGTSLPELIVNIYASYIGNTGLAIGNIVGSNIANILLILGATAIVYPVAVKSNTVFKEIPFSLFAVIILGFLGIDLLFNSSSPSVLSRIDGVILLSFFAVYLYYVYEISKKNKNESDEIHILSKNKSLFYILAGIIGLFLGGQLLVENAVIIAKLFGLSDTLIGLTVVAIGTSLPELITSVVAALKKKSDIAIGNVVGSNIFNIFWILGLSSLINPLSFDIQATADIIILLFSTLLLFLFLFNDRKFKIEKKEGYIFLILYFLYLIYLIFART